MHRITQTSIQVQDVCSGSLPAAAIQDFSQHSEESGGERSVSEKPQSGRRLTEQEKAPRKERAYHQELILGG